MKNFIARKTWIRPEILDSVSAKHAQIGSDSPLIDAAQPASNGSTPSFS